jgi:thioesterase domain-containing protein
MADDASRVVYEAWRSTLPNIRFDEDLPLIEAGVDSLRMLTMLLRIEAAWGQPVPADLLHADATPRSIAAGLTARAIPVGPPLPRAFLVGGLAGEDAMLATIRRELSSILSVERVPHLDSDDTTDLVAAGALTGERIARDQPDGGLVLIGYSYGGALAFEAARRLIALGRTVELLVLLDVVPLRSPPLWAWDAIRSPRIAWRKAKTRLGAFHRFRPGWKGLIVDTAFSLNAYGLVGKLAGPVRTGEELYDPARMRSWHLRAQSLRQWRPAPLTVRTLLIASEDSRFAAGPAFWRRLIPRLTILSVPGAHRELDATETLEQIAAAVQSAIGPTPTS